MGMECFSSPDIYFLFCGAVIDVEKIHGFLFSKITLVVNLLSRVPQCFCVWLRITVHKVLRFQDCVFFVNVCYKAT